MADLDPALVDILACPRTHLPLHPASDVEAARLPQDADAWLVRQDGAVAYPVIDNIPRLLPEDAVELTPA